MRIASVAGIMLLAATSSAAACTLDNVASATLNGKLAVRNKNYPKTPAQLKIYAPFIFHRRLATGEHAQFGENKKEVSKSLTRSTMRRPPQWRFGDGKRAVGWSVIHTYKRPGTYLITVWASAAQHQWYEFDGVNVRVHG